MHKRKEKFNQIKDSLESSTTTRVFGLLPSESFRVSDLFRCSWWNDKYGKFLVFWNISRLVLIRSSCNLQWSLHFGDSPSQNSWCLHCSLWFQLPKYSLLRFRLYRLNGLIRWHFTGPMWSPIHSWYSRLLGLYRRYVCMGLQHWKLA